MNKNLLNIKILIIFILFLIANGLYGKNEYLKIHFIDVGEGDSIFIEFPDNKNILVDTGNAVSGVKVYNYLKRNNIEKIDHLIITHPHPDHFSGMFLIAQLFKVNRFYDNNQDIDEYIQENDFYRWYNDFFREDRRYTNLKAGDIINFNNAKLEVLWPDELIYEDWNANSLVIMIKYGNFKVLLMADANKLTESEFIQRNIDIQANILKAGHHGADDTGLEEFIKKVHPEITIISVDKNNIRGYPSQDVVNNYIKYGSKIYSTYKNGTIIINAKKDGKYIINFKRF